jgi:hypothetical protein
MGGAIITESIFNVPGVGFTIFRAIRLGESTTVVSFVTVLVMVYLIANLIVTCSTPCSTRGSAMPDRPSDGARGTAFPGPGREGGAENPLRTDDVLVESPTPTDASRASGAVDVGTGKPRSLWSDAWHDLLRKPVFVGAALLIVALTIVAVAPGLFTDTDPKFCDLQFSNQTGQPGHPFGYDRRAATSTPGCCTAPGRRSAWGCS